MSICFVFMTSIFIMEQDFIAASWFSWTITATWFQEHEQSGCFLWSNRARRIIACSTYFLEVRFEK